MFRRVMKAEPLTLNYGSQDTARPTKMLMLACYLTRLYHKVA